MTKNQIIKKLVEIKQDLENENDMLYKEPSDMTSEIRYNEGFLSAINYVMNLMYKRKEVK